MIYAVDVSRKVEEFAEVLVEAEDPSSAMAKALDSLRDDEDSVEWTDYTERTDDECEAIRAVDAKERPWLLSVSINGEPAKLVLQDNGTYILE